VRNLTAAGWRAVACGLAFVTLAGCTSIRLRLERGLIRVGVERPIAACMAENMAVRLTLAQARRLGRLERLDEDVDRGPTLDRFLADVAALRDPEILAVTSAAGLICWTLTPREPSGRAATDRTR
jgi:hypothetical protein